MPTAASRQGFVYGEHTGEYVEIQKLRIHVTAGGEGDPLLLIHGIGQSAYAWRQVFDELCEHFFVIAVDMIGYGYSDKPDLTYTIEENSEFLLALLNTLRIRQTDVVALGSGACYVLDFMIHYPERVNRAVCIAPGGLTPKMPLSVRAMKTSLSKAASMMFSESTVRSLLASCLFDQTCLHEKDVVETYRTLSSREAKEVLSRSIRNFDEQDVASRLRLLPHEVLYVWGSEDRWRPFDPYATTYLAATPKASQLVMRNCGHLPHEEKPQRFVKAVVEFLHDGTVSDE